MTAHRISSAMAQPQTLIPAAVRGMHPSRPAAPLDAVRSGRRSLWQALSWPPLGLQAATPRSIAKAGNTDPVAAAQYRESGLRALASAWMGQICDDQAWGVTREAMQKLDASGILSRHGDLYRMAYGSLSAEEVVCLAEALMHASHDTIAQALSYTAAPRDLLLGLCAEPELREVLAGKALPGCDDSGWMAIAGWAIELAAEAQPAVAALLKEPHGPLTARDIQNSLRLIATLPAHTQQKLVLAMCEIATLDAGDSVAEAAGKDAAGPSDIATLQRTLHPWGPTILNALAGFPQIAAPALDVLAHVHTELLAGTDACRDWSPNDDVISPIDWVKTVSILQRVPQNEWDELVDLAIDCQLTWSGKPDAFRDNTSDNIVPFWEVRFSPDLACFETVLEALSQRPQAERATLVAQAMDYLTMPLRQGKWIARLRDTGFSHGLFTILARYAKDADSDLIEAIARAAMASRVDPEILFRTLCAADETSRGRILQQIDSAKLWAAGDYEGALQKMQFLDKSA